MYLMLADDIIWEIPIFQKEESASVRKHVISRYYLTLNFLNKINRLLGQIL